MIKKYLYNKLDLVNLKTDFIQSFKITLVDIIYFFLIFALLFSSIFSYQLSIAKNAENIPSNLQNRLYDFVTGDYNNDDISDLKMYESDLTEMKSDISSSVLMNNLFKILLFFIFPITFLKKVRIFLKKKIYTKELFWSPYLFFISFFLASLPLYFFGNLYPFIKSRIFFSFLFSIISFSFLLYFINSIFRYFFKVSIENKNLSLLSFFKDYLVSLKEFKQNISGILFLVFILILFSFLISIITITESLFFIVIFMIIVSFLFNFLVFRFYRINLKY